MKAPGLQPVLQAKPRREPLRPKASCRRKRAGTGLGVQGRGVWPAAEHCGRCRGLMYRIQLRDWGGGRGQDGCDALQCMVCGDIIDQVIARNRRCSGQATVVRRKTREGRPRIAMTL